MPQTVASATVRLLADAGIRTAYTVPGESFLPLLDELAAEPRIRLISTRHESGAAFMAEAEAKLTGRPALALASRGPGAANLAIGVHTAHQDQTPMLAILGQVDKDVRGTGGFQEVDLEAFYRPITVWSCEPDHARDVPRLAAEALGRMWAPTVGPVALSVPTDFWSMPYDGSRPALPESPPPDADLPRIAGELAELITTARQPVAIAGPGNQVGRKELRLAAEQLGFGVYVAFRCQDSFAVDHPHFLGHLGLGTTPAIRQALDDADLLLVLGTRLDAITSQDFRYPLPHQHLVVVGRGLAASGSAAQASSVRWYDVDPREVLAALRAAPTVTRDWSRYHETAVHFAHHRRSSDGPHPADVVRTLHRLAPPDVIVTNDAGNFSGFLHRYWPFTTTHRQLGPRNGAMGYAVPAAVAAKLAEPHRTVVAFVGDGGILMTGQEIETAVRHDARIVVLAFANRMYGTIAMHQARAHRRLAATDIGSLDLVRWAEGLGAHGLLLDDPSTVEDTLRAALRSERPCVVDIRTDPDIIAPELRLSDLLT
ncbi:MAG TPA: thiamine pyrophosphate-dependent enzyme [Actinopolymorphaceae bacterium]|jgi:acetolactate synthase-1/2/3 large subunit